MSSRAPSLVGIERERVLEVLPRDFLLPQRQRVARGAMLELAGIRDQAIEEGAHVGFGLRAHELRDRVAVHESDGVGIERRLKVEASSGLVSEFTFTSFQWPPYSRSSFSSSGPSTLHGRTTAPRNRRGPGPPWRPRSHRVQTSKESRRSSIFPVSSLVDGRGKSKVQPLQPSRVAGRKAGDPGPGGA
jgi:hypothetical protein